MTKKAVVIVGPEGCGNRLLASAFNRAGCHGDGSTKSIYNKSLPPEELPDGKTGAVLIRSYPHGNEWPDLIGLDNGLKQRGFETVYIVTTRDFSCYQGSWIKDRPRQAGKWQENYQKAYLSIFHDIAVTCAPFVIAPYEAVMMRQAAFLSRLVSQCGFPYEFFTLTIDGTERNIADANAKYYK